MPIRFLALIISLLALAAPAFAADTNHDIKGLYLLTDYPAVTVQPGTTSTVSLKLRNYALVPERLTLSVAGVPQGWTATLLGSGQPIAAAMPATDDSVSFDLRLDVPKDAKIGTQTLTVTADGATSHVALPVAVMLAKELPAKLSLAPQLPELRGSSRSSFEYTLTIKNDSGKKLLVSLAITGEPKLTLAGREGLLSARATAGSESSVPVVVTNTGTAPAENIQLSGNAPNGWKITFEPKIIDRIAPSQNKEVQALIRPPEKAIAGDYVTTLTASTRGENGTGNFRVTVTTSTMWGIAGIGIIGAALLIM